MTRDEKVKELFKDSRLADFELEGFYSANDLIESLNQQIDEMEVVYYSNAIKYLSENDESLRDSLEIAEGLGYELKNLNSETLATLLQQQNLRDELAKKEKEIDDIYNEEKNE